MSRQIAYMSMVYTNTKEFREYQCNQLSQCTNYCLCNLKANLFELMIHDVERLIPMLRTPPGSSSWAVESFVYLFHVSDTPRFREQMFSPSELNTK